MIEGTLIAESIRVGGEIGGVRLVIRKIRRADFRTPQEKFVVWSGRVFRYPRGDAQGRAEAAAYGRAVVFPRPSLTGRCRRPGDLFLFSVALATENRNKSTRAS